MRLGNPLVHGGLVTVLLLGAILALGAGSYLAFVVQLVVVYVIAVLGLNVPAGFGGALSLGQGAAFGVGAYTVAILVERFGTPVWLTLPAALAAGLLLGLVMGIPASRLGTIGLAMISLGFTIVAGDIALQATSITGGFAGLSGITPSWWFGPDRGLPETWLAVVVLALGLATYVWHWRFRSSPLGRATVATRDSTIGAQALGIHVDAVRARAFALGTAVGAVAGALYVYLLGVVTPTTADAWLSIAMLAMVILGGSGSRVGPVAGAVLLSIIPIYLSRFPYLSEFLYGALLIAAVRFMPRGLVPGGAAALPGQRAHPRQVTEDGTTAQQPIAARGSSVIVGVGNVSKRFDGVYALHDVTLDLCGGEVLGIVGPNGSGKTTLLNIISGYYPATTGRVELLGSTLRRSPREVARAGVGRTFQTPRIFPSLSVEEHMALAEENRSARTAADAGAGAQGYARELLRIGGLLGDHAGALQQEAGTLAHGQLRFLELAMATVRDPAVLLLDEPAAGLSAAEIDELEGVIRRVRDQGKAVVMVEHHLDLVRRVADRIAVLHLGRLLWVGAPADLEDVAQVREAYLGGVPPSHQDAARGGGAIGRTASRFGQGVQP